MKRYALPGIIVAGLLLRVVLPYRVILGGAVIKFADVDSYYYAAGVRALADGGQTPSAYMAALYKVTQLPLLNLITPEITMMIVTLILHVVIVVLVYRITAELWGRTYGLIAAAVISVMPGEYLGRSILGAIDHHVAEVMLSTAALFMVLGMLRAGKKWVMAANAGAAIILMCNYALIWSGWLLFAAVLAGGLLLSLALAVRYPLAKVALVLAGVVIGVNLLRAVLVFPDITWQTTTETAPIYSPLSVVALIPYSLVIVGTYACWKDYKESRDSRLIMLIVWNLVILAATFMQRRFGYYLAVNAAVMMAMIMHHSVQQAGKIKDKLALGITAALVIAMLPLSVRIAADVQFAPPEDWVEAMGYIREDTEPDAEIAAWSDYGYWIEYMGERQPVATPAQGEKEMPVIAEILTTSDMPYISAHADYLVLDRATMTDNYRIVERWAGRTGADSIAQRLWQTGREDWFNLVYSNDEVRVYRMTDLKDIELLLKYYEDRQGSGLPLEQAEMELRTITALREQRDLLKCGIIRAEISQ